MPWWSQPVADEEPPADHVHCGEVYEPQDARRMIEPKRRQRVLARISDAVRVRGVRFLSER